MAKKLTTYVHAVEHDDKGKLTGRSGSFGPDDELPDWAAKAITNPDVWEGTEAGDNPAPEQPRTPRRGRPTPDSTTE